MRDLPSFFPPFLSFCFFFGNVYAIAGNFIIVLFLPIRNSFNLPRKNSVQGNEKEVISESL